MTRIYIFLSFIVIFLPIILGLLIHLHFEIKKSYESLKIVIYDTFEYYLDNHFTE